MGDTTARSSPSSRFRSDDLPTLGRPTRAIRSGAGSSSAGATRGRPSRAASNRSPTPRPCSAEIGRARSKPRGANSATPSLAASTLLTARTTRLPLRLIGGGAEKRVMAPEEQPPGIHQLEGGALPRDLRVVAVPRGAGAPVGDRFPATTDPVEQGRLAHVGPADEGDAGDGDQEGSTIDRPNGLTL